MYILLVIFLAIILIDFTVNYLRNNLQGLEPEMFSGEKEDFRFRSNWIYKKTEKIVSSHRYFYYKKNWFLNFYKTKFFHFNNTDSYLMYRSTNIFLIALALIGLYFIPPIGYAISLVAINSVFYMIIFRITRGSWSTPIFIFSSLKSEKSLLKKICIKFELNRSRVVNQLLYVANTSEQRSFIPNFDRIEEFSFEPALAIAMSLFTVVSVLQRVLERHFIFDSIYFLPFVLFIPIFFGIISGRKTGFISGLLGLWMMYAIMIPFSFHTRFNDYGYLSNGSGTPIFLFILLSLALGLVGLCAAFLSNHHPFLLMSAFLPWIIIISILVPSNLASLSLWGSIAVSAGFIFLILRYFDGIKRNIERMESALRTGKGRIVMSCAVVIVACLFYFALSQKYTNLNIYNLSELKTNLSHKLYEGSLEDNLGKGTRLRLQFTRKLDREDEFMLDGYRQIFTDESVFVKQVNPGVHQISINAGGSAPLLRTIIVLEDEERLLSFSLPERIGSLNLESEPSNAKVFVNGNDVGSTPIQLDKLKPGYYSVKFDYGSEYVPVLKEYQVEIGQTINDKVIFGVFPGILKVSMTPGAIATVDGKQILNTIELAPGNYNVTFSYPTAFGANPVNKNVTIESKRTSEVSFYFPAFGSMQIVCNPWASIYIDNQFVKESSAVNISKITEGKHRISIKKQGYPEYSGIFDIIANTENRIVLNFNFTQKAWVLR